MDLKTIIENENHSVETKLLGRDFVISADRNVYNAIRRKFKKLALDAKVAFADMDRQFDDIHDLIENAPNAFITAVEPALLELLQDIVSVDIYTIDKDTVIDKAFDGVFFDEFAEAFGQISSRYEKIFQELNDAEYYRECRKDSRPRWQSATIGGNAINAWSNELEAGMMNLTEGIAHSIVNAIGNAIDRANAKSELEELFKMRSLRENMIDSVYDSCFNLHLLLIELVNANTENDIRGTVDEEDKKKAAAMFNNFTSLNLSPEKTADFIDKMFSLDPYNEEIYSYIINKFGDESNDVETFADFFSMNPAALKADILVEFVNNHIGKTEDDAHECERLLEEEIKRVNIDEKYAVKAREMVKERLEKLDLEYRTVDGIIFETRDEADVAKVELAEIQRIMSVVNPPTKQDNLRYERDLQEKRVKIDSYTTKVKEKYIQKIDEYLDKFDKVFRGVGLVSEGMTREEKGRQLALTFVKNRTINSYEDLEKARQALEAYMPDIGITIDQATEANEYLEQCRRRLNVVDGVQFESREEADEGRKELQEIQEIMKEASPPEKDSLLPYEKRIQEIKEKLQPFKTNIKLKYISILDGHLQKFDTYFKSTGAFSKAETREAAARDKALKHVKSIAGANCTYADIDNARKSLEEFLPLIGIEMNQAVEALEYLQSQENRLNTVDGVTFESREAAAFGLNEYNQIVQIMSSVVPPQNDPLVDYENDLLNTKAKIEQFQTPIKQKYIAVIAKHLDDFDKKFRKVSLIKTCNTREEAANERALKFVKSKTIATLDDVAKARQELAEYLPHLGITMEQATGAVQHLNNIESKLNGTSSGGKLGSLFGKFKK